MRYNTYSTLIVSMLYLPSSVYVMSALTEYCCYGNMGNDRTPYYWSVLVYHCYTCFTCYIAVNPRYWYNTHTQTYLHTIVESNNVDIWTLMTFKGGDTTRTITFKGIANTCTMTFKGDANL